MIGLPIRSVFPIKMRVITLLASLACPSLYALPDLIPINIAVSPTSIGANGTVNVSFSILNQGTTTANPTTTTVRINSSASGTAPGDQVLANIATGTIPPGNSFNVSTNFNVGSTTGTHY